MQNLAKCEIYYRVCDGLSDEALNGLYEECWPDHRTQSYRPILDRSLLYVSAYHNDVLVGFVNVAWDGGEHGFLLDTAVTPTLRRQGIGTELVKRAIAEARNRNIKWVHVDFEPHLSGFYANCGFRPTEAGLIRLKPESANSL
jgi:GNAT superfamily N-acetyltransferase